ASGTIHPTYATPTGTIVITAPVGAGFDYSLDGGAIQFSLTFTLVARGVHNVTARNTTDNSCVSLPTPLTVNAVPAVPAAPTASVTIQPTCATPTGTIVITAPVGAGFDYSLDGGAFQVSPTFTLVAPGTHNVTARNTTDNSCVSLPTPLTV